jgi:hypothetical protein
MKHKEDPSQLLFDFMKPPVFKFEDISWVYDVTPAYIYQNANNTTITYTYFSFNNTGNIINEQI